MACQPQRWQRLDVRELTSRNSSERPWIWANLVPRSARALRVEQTLGQHQQDNPNTYLRVRELLRDGRSREEEDVEQTQGQRQTGRNDLPGKGERVASGW